MKFGIREKVTNLGRFTSDKCRSCKSGKFRMDKKVRYLILFGVRTVPLRVRYSSVCERCGAEQPVGSRTARYLARKHFRRAQARHQFSMILRAIIAIVIAVALVTLPFGLRFPVSRDPDVLKSLVSADGDYAIKNANDEVLALIHVEGGVKTITWYDKLTILQNTGSRGGRFYQHETYVEAVDSAGNSILIRDQDNPGQLLDQHNTIIRQYYYVEETDSLDYYQGVEDLAAIHYTARKVTYPTVFYNEYGEKLQYLTVLYLLGNAQLRANFMMSTSTGAYDLLASVSIDKISGNRVTDQTVYYLNDNTISLAVQAGLTQDSAAQDFADFITLNGMEPTTQYHFEFYGNTRVISSQTATEPDYYGMMQTTTMNYIVTPKRGYYIVQLADSSTAG